MQSLNPQQREAVCHLDSPLLVLAGAGSGKTGVITNKIAYLVRECGIPAHSIAAITFTNKAAREMHERVEKLLGSGGAKGLTVSTFHALGARILRQEAKHCGLKPGFSILDATDTTGLFQDILGATADKGHVRAVQTRISLWKNALLDPEAASQAAVDEFERGAASCYTEYQRTLQAYQAVDFDDLIRVPTVLFERDQEARGRWQNKLRHLLVDEYQDTNTCQYRLMKLIAGPRAAFTAVGDDDQSIYAWRGADIENIRALQQDYPNLKVIKLEQNYRSTTRILQAANNLIAHNPKVFDKRLWSDNGHGEVISVNVCRDGEQEAEWVSTRLATHKFEHRGKWSDYAILYRGNHQARAFEQQLRNQRIPYQISGGQSFFERTEIKDLISYLRLIANSDEDPAFIRAVTTPRRGIGGTTLEALGTYAGERHISLFAAACEAGAEQHVKPAQLASVREFCDFINRMEWRAQKESAAVVLNDIVRAIGYETWLFENLEPREAETKWANVQDFVGWLGRKGEDDGKTLVELTQTIALITMLDKQDQDVDAVQLATLHAAKGLEFRHVFLVGIEEGMLPHRESLTPDKLEEERRLMYVGITRARNSLILTHCEKRKQGKEWRTCEPSRFIGEMGAEIKLNNPRTTTSVSAEEGRAKLARFRELLASKT
ncbi:MAG TPA: UvrD-helicase domain-containing protein [Rhodocyclaceae bacterium]|nr:UvrD-helicase domain-containing protein [Rhodocyclaceae bacterium]